VGNYSLDAQESMQRFAHVMFEGLRRGGCHVELLVPPVIFGRWANATTRGLGKWFGYIDKYLVFPFRLRSAMKARTKATGERVVAHICDHSNSVYTRWTSGVPVVVTCHDLLAVRGALGEQTDCPASFMGRQLQRWIVQGLVRASVIVSVSRATGRDVERIVGPAARGQRRCVVHMGLNHGYRQLEASVVETRLEESSLQRNPYILHVGSNLRRKNREGVLRIFARVAERWNGLVVFAGEPLSEEIWALAHALRIHQRVVEVSKPDTSLMEALYNGATALVFPSRFEGFGWPIIEAQASGCPVICSNAGPLPEVAGDGGIVCPLDNEDAFASAILRLRESAERELWIRRGLSNATEFTTERMIDGYLAAYDSLEVAK
jgi:glycosyltransferase involved in cell wall biosynthesis